MLILLFLSLLPVFSLAGREEDDAEFLFKNSKICGNPFSDPIWVPVLDICNVQCDRETQYCVENEELQQQCNNYPYECLKLLQKNRRKRQQQRKPAPKIHSAAVLNMGAPSVPFRSGPFTNGRFEELFQISGGPTN